MEVDNSVNHVVAKKLWNMLRVAFFMLRKGVVLKRKMMLDIHMMMKRGKVLGKKTLGSLMYFHHSHGKTHHYSTGMGIKEYEFSCSNSPAPPSLSFHMGKKRLHFFSSFPCIQPRATDEHDCHSNAVVIPRCEYITKNNMDLSDLPAMEEITRALSPFCGGSDLRCCEEEQVDRKAEEFISRFYNQIRLQRQVSFIQYDEMLARGTG